MLMLAEWEKEKAGQFMASSKASKYNFIFMSCPSFIARLAACEEVCCLMIERPREEPQEGTKKYNLNVTTFLLQFC